MSSKQQVAWTRRCLPELLPRNLESQLHLVQQSTLRLVRTTHTLAEHAHMAAWWPFQPAEAHSLVCLCRMIPAPFSNHLPPDAPPPHLTTLLLYWSSYKYPSPLPSGGVGLFFCGLSWEETAGNLSILAFGLLHVRQGKASSVTGAVEDRITHL